MDSLSILDADREIVLHGPGARGTFKGARRAGTGAEISVDLLLEGAPGEILDDLAALGRMLAEAGRPDAVRLRLRPEAGGAVYETSVLAAALELPGEGAEARLRGSTTARLKLASGGYWEGAEGELALNGVVGGTVLSGPPGALEIAAEGLPGDLPAPFRLELGLGPGAAAPLGEVWVALDARPGGPPGGLRLEGEQGAGGTTQSDPACSGGAFARCSAPAGQESVLLTWTLPAELLAECAGRTWRAAMRLAAGAPEGVWARWELRAGEATLSATLAQRLEGGQALALLPALSLPAGAALAPLKLCLLARSDAALALDVDFLHLLPQDGFQHLRPLAPLPPGATLVADGRGGQVYQRGPDGCLPVYAAAGAPPRLRPGRDQRLYVLHAGAINLQLTARVWLRPRWSQV